MGLYQKYLITVALLAIAGILVFMLNYSNLSWQSNKESYWGIIAMLALIGSIIMNNRSHKLEQKIKDLEK